LNWSTKYTYDADGNLIEEKNVLTTETKKYYYSSENRMIKYEHYPTDVLPADITTTYKHGDWEWTIAETKTYDVFGNTINQTGNSAGNLGFQSKYFDNESGMYYYYNRYYKPDLGRFLNEDPIGLNGGLNMFAFVNNNPINYTDPYGLEKVRRYIGRIVEIIIKCNIDIGNVKKAKILMSKFKSNEKVKSNLVECESWLFYIKNEIDKSVKIIKGRSKFKNLFIELIWDTETKFRDGMILKSVDHYSAIDNFEKCIEHGTVRIISTLNQKK